MMQFAGKLLANSIKHLVVVLFLLAVPLMAQSPKVITRSGWSINYGGPYEIYYQAVPTALTDLDTRDSRLIGYCVYNNTAGPLTFTIQTKDASPVPLPLTGSLAVGTAACNNTPFGLLSKGGFSVQASGAGLYYGVIWTH
jgi:hypothetical protein